MRIHFFEQYGRFNWADPTQETTQWYISLKHNDGSIVVLNGIKCQLRWSEDGDQRGMYSLASDTLEYMAQKSWEHANLYYSADYRDCTLAFVKVFNDNRKEILETYDADRKERIQKQIAELEKSLDQNNLDDSAIAVADIVEEDIDRYKQLITSGAAELTQLKEGTPLYEDKMKRIEAYKTSLNNLLAWCE